MDCPQGSQYQQYLAAQAILNDKAAACQALCLAEKEAKINNQNVTAAMQATPAGSGFNPVTIGLIIAAIIAAGAVIMIFTGNKKAPTPLQTT